MSGRRFLGRSASPFALVILAALGVIGVVNGCEPVHREYSFAGVGGSRPGSVIVAATASAAVISVGALGGTMEEDAGDPCAPQPLWPGVPEGWVEYLDWSCTCRMFIPGSKDAMPKPIAWEPCPTQPSGIDCRAMVIDWTDSTVPISYGDPQFDLQPDGTALLGIRRISETSLLDMAAEVDGAVRMAILRVPPPGEVLDDSLWCSLGFDSLNEGKYLFQVTGDRFTTPTRMEGALGGSIDDPRPTVVARIDNKDGFLYGWQAGASWIIRMTPWAQVDAFSWDMSTQVFVTSPPTDVEGNNGSQFVVRGDAVFWSTGAPMHAGINAWLPKSGARHLVRWVGDFTRGAGDLGTDGKYLVWAYGEKQPDDHYYVPNSIMVSPFTTDPWKLKPRRLRSLPDKTIGNRQFVVGCGYAAHHMADDTGRATLVVRIRDGVSWIVPHSPTFEHENVLGITCDDVFILGDIADRTNIIRVRLDSLGPGIPPD